MGISKNVEFKTKKFALLALEKNEHHRKNPSKIFWLESERPLAQWENRFLPFFDECYYLAIKDKLPNRQGPNKGIKKMKTKAPQLPGLGKVQDGSTWKN